MAFITEDFLLQSKVARRLYHEYAAVQPILDYHCHLSAKDIADGRQFRNLCEIWLEGDHYKWRAMRANGIRSATALAMPDPYDKFVTWAQTVPQTLRNPLVSLDASGIAEILWHRFAANRENCAKTGIRERTTCGKDLNAAGNSEEVSS